MKVCKTCLNVILDSEYYNLNRSCPNFESFLLKEQCKLCIPELDIDLTADAVLCGSCYKMFNLFYHFRLKCLENEKKIRSWLRSKNFIGLNALASKNHINDVDCVTNTTNLERFETTFKMELDEEPTRKKPDKNFEDETIAVLFNQDFNNAINVKQNTIETQSSNDKSLVKIEHTLQNHRSNQSTSSADFLESKFIRGKTKKGDKRLKCSYRTFPQINEKNHIERCFNKKLYKCKECSYETWYKSGLTTHITQHMKEQPYKCKICSVAYRRNNNLQKHIRTHVNAKLFKCSSCEFESWNGSYLHSHLKLHSEMKRFICDICDQQFAHKVSLTRHVQYHLKYHSGRREEDFKSIANSDDELKNC